MAVLLITHDMGVIAGRADRVVVMYAGKIAEEAETGVLFSKMRHPYSEALLASVPKLDQDPSIRLLHIAGLPPDLSQTITNCRFAPRCRYATDRCRNEEPELLDYTDPGMAPHRYACFHPVDTPVEPRSRPSPCRATVGSPSGPGPCRRRPSLSGSTAWSRSSRCWPGRSSARTIGQVHAVSDVTFSIKEGETFGLVGESGCGKTTIGRLMVGLEQPTSGHVDVRGHRCARAARATPLARAGVTTR